MPSVTRSDISAVGTPLHASRRQTIGPLITLALLVAIGSVLYEACQVWRLNRQVQILQQEKGRSAETIRQLEQERDKAVRRLAASSAGCTLRLPAPTMQAISQPDLLPVEGISSTNLYARFKDRSAKLTAEQVEAYLKANGRQAASLLAAYRTSGNAMLLTEAIQNYPGDPNVAFEAAFAKDLSPEQRRQRLNAFVQADPGNALPNYLLASDYFKAGQTDLAVEELLAASGKQHFRDFTLDRMQDNEEAYLAAGYSPAEAKLVASGQVTLPQLSALKQLGLKMVELSNSYRNAGDETSAQTLLQMTVRLGQNYDGQSVAAISHLVGLTIERNALSAMDPDSPYDNSGVTVKDQLNRITQEKSAISTLFKQNQLLLETMSDQDWISYVDRNKSFGEEAALQWAIRKLSQK